MTSAALGKVYLVGAGPGHPELLTVKAARLLEAGDVIVYDRLIQEEVVALAKPSAERIYMGKKVGLHESRQDEIHALLLRKAREGKMVVRLKGGDPFLFGRGGEEAEFLAEHGVPFEVVPGVSSALAAPLSAGIAVTHRDVASSVAIVTGHEASREDSRVNWNALAGVDTLVFLMAVHNIGRIAGELIAHGRDPQTPAAIVQMAYWHGERVAEGTLETIAAEAERAGVSPPATLVVGEAVRLRDKLKHSERDLRRRPDRSAFFEPAPSPDQLLRVATAGMGSQALFFALAASVFEFLEQWRTAPELARLLGLNTLGLAEILECLASLGLLECGPEGYRNLELASRYLLDGSPHTLKPALLALAAQAAPLNSVGRYVLNGRQDGGPPEAYELQKRSSECLARYAAPFVLDHIDLAGRGDLLLVGWGGRTYGELIARRWPDLRFDSRNPFENGAVGDPARSLAAGGSYDAILFSELLACCERDQFGPALAGAAHSLKPGGILILHDAFLSSETPSAPEVVLSAFGRHVVRGGSRNWSLARLRSELSSLGLEAVSVCPVPGGAQLVTARSL